MGNIVSEAIQVLISGIVPYAEGLGEGLVALVKAIFVEETTVEGVTTRHLGIIGGVSMVFAGIALAMGLSRWVLNWITSLGQRNR